MLKCVPLIARKTHTTNDVIGGGMKEQRFQQNVCEYADWESISEVLNNFPRPLVCVDGVGEVYRQGWIFRGTNAPATILSLSVERAAQRNDWVLTEYRLLEEFQSRAPMHMSPAHLPAITPEAKLSWLAIMQHYGAPTRLLDFTYSPFVALYFALRAREGDEATHAEIWAIDAAVLQNAGQNASRAGDRVVREHNQTPRKSTRVSLRRADMRTNAETVVHDDILWQTTVMNALNPCGARRDYYNDHGFVGIAKPPVQNVRLCSQQGVFLFNGAQELSFEESLNAGTQ